MAYLVVVQVDWLGNVQLPLGMLFCRDKTYQINQATEINTYELTFEKVSKS